MTATQPLVSVVTPAYNDEEYISDCIESILAQTYSNWDYTIVNNCSTDKSGDIARRYAARDPRIRVIDNQQFLKSIPNHNHTIRQISRSSKYCKMVFADDWIFPTCIEEMVELAEDHPSVGIVGAFGLWEAIHPNSREHIVKWGGLPFPSRCVPGRDIGRRMLMNELDIFGTATSVLYRSEFVFARDCFFNEANFHADKEACLVILKSADFGFVHQVLTFTRGRPGSLNNIAAHMYLDIGCTLQDLVLHGPAYLSAAEFDKCLNKLLATYYNFLAVNILQGRREKGFWDFHQHKLAQVGFWNRGRLARAILARLGKAILNPHETIRKVFVSRALAKSKMDTGRLAMHATELG